MAGRGRMNLAYRTLGNVLKMSGGNSVYQD
jgi:hypothetical protein